MEKTLRTHRGTNLFQGTVLVALGVFMFWVFERSGRDVSIAISMLTAATCTLSFFQGTKRQMRAAQTDRERLEINLQFFMFGFCVLVLLGVCLQILKH